jgi:hypothetical protein
MSGPATLGPSPANGSVALPRGEVRRPALNTTFTRR